MKNTNELPFNPAWRTLFWDLLLFVPPMTEKYSREEYEKNMEAQILDALNVEHPHHKPPIQCTNPVFIFEKMKTAFMAVYDIGASLKPQLPQTKKPGRKRINLNNPSSQTSKTLPNE